MAKTLFSHPARLLIGASALAVLSACDTPLDADLRDMGNGFDTSTAALSVAARPQPDDRGIISYPNYQVAVAQRDETVRGLAARLGLDAQTVARHNAISPDTPLRRGELITLPSRVAEPSPATGSPTTGPIQPPSNVNVTELASAAIDRAGPQQTAAQPAPAPASNIGVEPARHRVERGETIYSISRRYGVPVSDLAQWNGLGANLEVREGQQILIPQAGTTTPTPVAQPVTEPGQGSPTPTPPSARDPLPAEDPATPAPEVAAPPPSPDLGADRTEPAPEARLAYPVQGPIIRAYAAGRNEGIDIGASAGTAVKAADSGTVAAITSDTNGASIVVIRHEGALLTVYVNLEGVTVAKDDTVSRGQTIAKVPAGDPSYLHFEVRQGLNSVDPTDFLP